MAIRAWNGNEAEESHDGTSPSFSASCPYGHFGDKERVSMREHIIEEHTLRHYFSLNLHSCLVLDT